MIDYSEDWLISLLFNHAGSGAQYRACLYAFPSAVLAFVLVYLNESNPELTEEFDALFLSRSFREKYKKTIPKEIILYIYIYNI